MDTVLFYGRVRVLSRAAPFDCGLANWPCIPRSVKDGMLVWMIPVDTPQFVT